MPRPRKDLTTAIEMYGLGASIGDVADAHGVSRQAMWKALNRRAVPMRDRVLSGSANHFFIHGDGYGPEKLAAKMAVLSAVRGGRLVRLPCETCGTSPVAADGRSLVHAHHEDYSQPLAVRWLCVKCHFDEHHE